MRLHVNSFDLDQIYESGQCFRWRKVQQGDYEISAGDRCVRAQQSGSDMELSCDEMEFTAHWRYYFDLDTDYGALMARIDPEDVYLSAAAEYGKGMRILRQDLWEIIVSFLVSQNNNIPRIRKSIDALCARSNMNFPAPREVAALGTEGLRALGLGYRAEYIYETAEYYARYPKELDRLREMETGDAKSALQERKGIGPKVADCICLYGLHRMDAFPMDTHMKQVVNRYYPNGFPFSRYEGSAGLMQQYLFYYHLKKQSPERKEE